MRERTFRPGDLVRIRQWDDMKQEFGTNGWGGIACKFTFVDDMAELCGMTAVIAEIDGQEVFFDSSSCENPEYANFRFSTDMIEHADEAEVPEISCDALNEILIAR